MSSSVIGSQHIVLTRGDTMYLKINIMVDGEEYQPTKEDRVRFALKRSKLNADKSDYADVKPLILKDVPIETMELELTPVDTKDLGFGKYDYDIEITFEDGTVDTFISSTLELTREVH